MPKNFSKLGVIFMSNTQKTTFCAPFYITLKTAMILQGGGIRPHRASSHYKVLVSSFTVYGMPRGCARRRGVAA